METTTDLIEFLKEHEFGGATGRPRELNFWLRDTDGDSHKLTLDTNDFSFGDGLITDIGFTFKDMKFTVNVKPLGEKYWYKFFMSYCPVCGDGDTIRERQYGEKPADLSKIYETHEHYDYCLE